MPWWIDRLKACALEWTGRHEKALREGKEHIDIMQSDWMREGRSEGDSPGDGGDEGKPGARSRPVSGSKRTQGEVRWSRSLARVDFDVLQMQEMCKVLCPTQERNPPCGSWGIQNSHLESCKLHLGMKGAKGRILLDSLVEPVSLPTLPAGVFCWQQQRDAG